MISVLYYKMYLPTDFLLDKIIKLTQLSRQLVIESIRYAIYQFIAWKCLLLDIGYTATSTYLCGFMCACIYLIDIIYPNTRFQEQREKKIEILFARDSNCGFISK